MTAPDEITAEMLAREMHSMEGGRPSYLLTVARDYLLATRALASLQAEQANVRKFDPGTPILDEAGKLQGFRAKDAPERVRCWKVPTGITSDSNLADAWRKHDNTVTEGYFTAKGLTDD